jgi:hypothetical protein
MLLIGCPGSAAEYEYARAKFPGPLSASQVGLLTLKQILQKYGPLKSISITWLQKALLKFLPDSCRVLFESKAGECRKMEIAANALGKLVLIWNAPWVESHKSWGFPLKEVF